MKHYQGTKPIKIITLAKWKVLLNGLIEPSEYICCRTVFQNTDKIVTEYRLLEKNTV